ncbi:hypothetical protein [Methylobacterium sp. R2-1]|uniref:hypothetical protein n=1 Tax=Methylobacterium sp. R2-1 TaxID=2587064 RepID=UPI00160F8B53|nr:hypothetical protein [Methylobacterium sp. R2-1]MBB2965178.1 hypothetical protein [Methylobacterium sp. R2-1]
MIAPEITDHALLRWMERVHGIDVDGWRELMRAEVEEALQAFDGRPDASAASFVLRDQRVVTLIRAGKRPPDDDAAVCVPRVA